MFRPDAQVFFRVKVAFTFDLKEARASGQNVGKVPTLFLKLVLENYLLLMREIVLILHRSVCSSLCFERG